VPSDLDSTLQLLRDGIEEVERTAISNYQLWALKKIEAAREYSTRAKAESALKGFLQLGLGDPDAASKNLQYQNLFRDFPVVRNELIVIGDLRDDPKTTNYKITPSLVEKISRSLAGRVGWKGIKELVDCILRDNLEQNLLPIDEALLQRPIDSLYAEIFQESWKDLEGSPQRNEVAKTAATIKKSRIDLPYTR
jgi:hypothetical protein